MFSKYKKKILLSPAGGALIFLAFSIYADFGKLLDAFSQFNWYFFPLILALSFINYLFRFVRWEYYRKLVGINIKTVTSFMIFMASFVMTVTPGKMGEVIKSYLLREENGTPVSKSAPIILAERIADFVSIVLLCITGAYVFDYGQGIILTVGGLFIGCVVLISSRTLSMKIISLLEKISFLRKYVEHVHTSYNTIYQLVRPKPLIIATVISLFAWSFECLGFFVVLKVFSDASNIEVSMLIATFIYGFSTIIGSIAMLPGGLGVTDASMAVLLGLLKIPKNISVASTFIIRIATLWFSVVLGIIFVYLYQRHSHKNLNDIVIDTK